MQFFHNEPPPSFRTPDRKVLPAAPYERLANFYDSLMWHVDYIHWADYLIDIARRFKLPSGGWCEGGCGTGSIALRIARQGYAVAGFDQSSAMIRMANEKNRELELNVDFFVADFRSFSYPPLAFLFVVYDGLNYLTSVQDIHSFLEHAARVVMPDGLLVFDLCTARNSVRNLFDWYDVQHRDGYRYRRHSWYDEPARLHYNQFEILLDEAPDTVYLEEHCQRIYPLDEVQSWIADSEFNFVSMLGDVGFSPGSERNDRVHFILRRRS